MRQKISEIEEQLKSSQINPFDVKTRNGGTFEPTTNWISNSQEDGKIFQKQRTKKQEEIIDWEFDSNEVKQFDHTYDSKTARVAELQEVASELTLPKHSISNSSSIDATNHNNQN